MRGVDEIEALQEHVNFGTDRQKRKTQRTKKGQPPPTDEIDDALAAAGTLYNQVIHWSKFPPGFTEQHLGTFLLCHQAPGFDVGEHVIVAAEGRLWQGKVVNVSFVL